MALNVLRKPFAKLKSLKESSGSSKSSYTDGEEANGTLKVNGTPKEHGAKGITEERCKRSESRKRKSAQNRSRDGASKRIDPKFMEVGEGDGAALYKPFSMNMSKHREDRERFLFKNLDVTSKESSSSCLPLGFM
jgi:hypothetical protein